MSGRVIVLFISSDWCCKWSVEASYSLELVLYITVHSLDLLHVWKSSAYYRCNRL